MLMSTDFSNLSMDFQNPSIIISPPTQLPPQATTTLPSSSSTIPPLPPSSSCHFFGSLDQTITSPSPFKVSHLRRDYSEGTLYNHNNNINSDDDHNCDGTGDIVINGSDVFNCPSSSAAFMDELGLVYDGEEEDPFTKYIDINMIENPGQGDKVDGGGGNFNDNSSNATKPNIEDNNNNGKKDSDGCGNGDRRSFGGGEEETNGRKSSRAASNQNQNQNHHRHSFSLGDIEIVEPKKAMPPNKLAELWISDPKRAKRILANRQSAARSKERKARYISELEKRVHILQREAAALTTQLSIYQRDTTELTAENAELRLRLQTMEHQALMRDDLNDALKREVDRLRLSTGKVRNIPYAEPITNMMGMHPTSYTSSSTVPAPNMPQNVHQLLPLFHTSPSTTAPCPIPEYIQNSSSLICVQGLDQMNNDKGYFMKVEAASASTGENREDHLKVESPSISASGNESSTAVY